MTTNPEPRGKFDDGTCFICSVGEAPGEQLVESRWGLHRIWLCREHAAVVAQRMTEREQSRDEVIEGLMDSLMSGLGLVEPERRGRTRPRSAEEAEEIAAAEELDDQDAEDLAYAARAATLDRCAVCTAMSDMHESMAAYEVEGTTIHLCPRDEQAVLVLVEKGLGWREAVDKAGADLMRQIMPESLQRDMIRKHFEQRESEHDERGHDDD
jgi:hypothetical protein